MKWQSPSRQILLICFLILSASLLSLSIQPAHAASNLVCIGLTGSNVCPTSPPAFTHPSFGQGLEIAVNVENSSSFNAFDIAIKADPTVLNGTNILNIGDTFRASGGIVSIASECINGHPTQGNCSSQDGPGVVHVAPASNIVVTGGHLFNVTYHIGTGSTPIAYQTGCTNTSNDGNCRTTVTARGMSPVTLPAPTLTNAPDFTIKLNPSINTNTTDTTGT